MFNSISKRFKNDQQQQPAKNNQEMEGFICPICMASFNTPDLVQKHFDTNHNDVDNKVPDVLSPSVERKESIQNIQENLNDLKQSLDEEMWFNKELQKECERLQTLIDEKDQLIKIRTDTIDKQGQVVLALESSRDTLAAELTSVTQSRDELISANESLRAARDECVEKIAEMTDCEDRLRAVIDRQKLEHDTISGQLEALSMSAESSHCQSADMAIVTERCEISEKIAKLLQLEVDRLKAEHERNALEWSSQSDLLREEVTTYKLEKSEFLANHAKQFSELDNKIESFKVENLQLQNDIELTKKKLVEKEDKIVNMQRSWSLDQSTLANTLKRLEDTDSERQKAKALNQELGLKIKNLDSEMMQLRNANNNKEEELKNIYKTNKNLIEELNEVKQLLETERTDKNMLQSQVEMTDAANIVMEQLHSEKKSLQENILHLKKQLENETERNDQELSALRLEIQSEKEKVFNLNSSVVEKDEQIEEASKNNSQLKHNIEKLEKKIELEESQGVQLEDEIIALTRDLKAREESLNTFHTNYNDLKDELEKSVQKSEKVEENLRSELVNINGQLDSVKSKADMVEVLEKEIALKNANIKLLDKDLQVKKEELDRLTVSLCEIQRQQQELMVRESSNVETISNLQSSLSKQDSRITNQDLEINENRSEIKRLTQQIETDAKLLSDRVNQLSQCENKIVELERQIKETNDRAQSFQDEIEVQEIEKTKLAEDNIFLKSQIELTKRNLLEQETLVTSMVTKHEVLENHSTEINDKLKLLQNDHDKIHKEKLDLNNQFTLCKIEVDNLQELYSDSVKLQNEYQNKLDTVTADHAKTVKCLRNIEEQQKSQQLEYSKELDHLRKENLELKNHVKALTKTLNESSENYKQERLEAADKEFSLKSQNESLQTDLENLVKSLQRTEEDLETEKNLRESERNNMMEKISQLSEQVSALEILKDENEQKLEVFETDNIEQKLRLELVLEEKDKLLEKIIQLENSLKKQIELYSKKCRELDQLQSAILDLGRENQSLQISKEKLTNRQWIGDVDAVDCHTCHKPFSLTLRKHHCRNCGQVYCQDCSSKAASLAVSRNPVRVCDACYVEVQSHRRNSSVSSTSVSLQM